MGDQETNASNQNPEKTIVRIALTLGGSGSWASLFKSSIARELARILHIPVLDPTYKLSSGLWEKLSVDKTKAEYERLLSPPKQASEIIFHLDWYLSCGDVLFIDNRMLDTAIGQYTLGKAAQREDLEVYGVAFDDRLSPLAPAFLKSVIYPAGPDDLVRLALQTKVEIVGSV